MDGREIPRGSIAFASAEPQQGVGTTMLKSFSKGKEEEKTSLQAEDSSQRPSREEGEKSEAATKDAPDPQATFCVFGSCLHAYKKGQAGGNLPPPWAPPLPRGKSPSPSWDDETSVWSRSRSFNSRYAGGCVGRHSGQRWRCVYDRVQSEAQMTRRAEGENIFPQNPYPKGIGCWSGDDIRRW